MLRPHLLTLPLLIALGCGPNPAPAPVTATPVELTPKATQTTETPSAAADVQLKVCSLQELNQAIAKHSGKVVVCDMWSTSCAPCLRELPHLVALSGKHSADKLVCMTASLDYEGLPDQPVDSLRTPVLDVLKEKQAKLENYLLNEESDKVYEQLKLSSIPAVYVYGTDGKLAKLFDESNGSFSYEKDINPFVEELLKGVQ